MMPTAASEENTGFQPSNSDVSSTNNKYKTVPRYYSHGENVLTDGLIGLDPHGKEST